MKIIGVNGIRSTGRNSTDRLGGELKKFGYEFHDLNQPIRTPWTARFRAERDAIDLADISEHGDVVICHSYGCLKTAIAAKLVNYKAIFMFRPAMSRNYNWESVDPSTNIYCIYSKEDYTILLGSMLMYHPFGLAGFSGFKNKARNFMGSGAHSDDFKRPALTRWAAIIHDELRRM